jgi:molybdenum cofactor synthesis domain-containing protein
MSPAERALTAALLTISTSRAAQGGADQGGEALQLFAEELGLEVVARETLTDDRALIAERLRALSDELGVRLILTTGGTGFTGNDLTPEATADVIERQVPGIGEAMRAASRPHTRHWMLSRAIAGIRGSTLIVNFPGSPKSIAETGEALAVALPHALRLLGGEHDPH